MNYGALASVPLLVAINAFFVAAEYSLVAIRSSQIETLRLKGRVRAAAALSALKDDAASAIGAIQVGITVTGLLLGWMGEPAISGLIQWVMGSAKDAIPAGVLHGLSLAVSFTAVTIVTVVMGELLPKAMTLKHVMSMAALTGPPILLFTRAMWPAVKVINTIANLTSSALGLGRIDNIETQTLTSDELGLIASEAAADGVLTERERSLILNALSLGARPASAIMVPRVKVAYLDLQRSMEDNRAVMNEFLYSRLPLCNGGMDQVIGVVYTKEFLTAYQEEMAAADSSVLQLICRPAVYVPVTLPLDRLLNKFHASKQHMLFLVDEHGGMEGIVTVADVVDELLTTIEERGAGADATGARVLVVEGQLSLRDLAAQLGVEEISPGEATTIGGLVVETLGRIPSTGETVKIGKVQVRVIEATRRAVKRVEARVAE